MKCSKDPEVAQSSGLLNSCIAIINSRQGERIIALSDILVDGKFLWIVLGVDYKSDHR